MPARKELEIRQLHGARRAISVSFSDACKKSRRKYLIIKDFSFFVSREFETKRPLVGAAVKNRLLLFLAERCQTG